MRPLHVDGEDAVPLLLADLEHRAHGHVAREVDKDVDWAEPLSTFGERRLDVSPAGDVARRRHHGRAAGPRQARGLLQGRGRRVSQKEPGALGGEGERAWAAEPAARASEHDDVIRELHAGILSQLASIEVGCLPSGAGDAHVRRRCGS